MKIIPKDRIKVGDKIKVEFNQKCGWAFCCCNSENKFDTNKFYIVVDSLSSPIIKHLLYYIQIRVDNNKQYTCNIFHFKEKQYEDTL
jgi:hypothetical protein